MKKTKEEDTSRGTRKKKHSKGEGGGGRLSSMIESMQERASPMNAHKVATQYFENFRKERHIPQGGEKKPESKGLEEERGEPDNAAITAVDTTVVNAVDNVSEKKTGTGKRSSEKSGRRGAHLEFENTHGPSEWRVYTAMRGACKDKKGNELRFGLTQLKKMTGLSDKTIRVSIHSLEQKMNIEVVEPSLGVYGRKFRVYSPDEVIKRRQKEDINIDITTKKVKRAEK